MAYLYVVEAATLFVGSAPPNNDKGLIIDHVKIPDMESHTQLMHPGGSWGEIEVGNLGMKALVMEFAIKGTDPQAMGQFGLTNPNSTPTPYTVYGAVRDKTTGIMQQVKAVCIGAMKRITTDNWKRGDLPGQTYQVSEMIHYELYQGPIGALNEIFYWDFVGRTWRVGGVQQNADINSALAFTG